MTDLTPSAEQQEILDRGLDTIRIRAGAGTGKTTTVAMVVANLVRNHGVEPERVLGITFTNKAAAELADRIKDLLGESVDEGRQAEVHTYHGFAAQIMAEFGALAGVDTRVRVITPTFSRQILGEIYQQTTYQILDITSSVGVDKIRVLGDRLGDHLLTPLDVVGAAQDGDTWPLRLEMLGTLERYERDKRRLGVVDYSDLVMKAEWLMRTYSELSAEVRDRYQAVVLDEYQDTNPAQRALLTAIFGNGMPVIGVGDEDQTIYEWRGASAENFELFPIHFKDATGAEASSLSLTLNRRSANSILKVANLVRRRANPGAPALVSDDPEKTGTVITHWATDVVAEADWISRKFQALHDDGTPWREMAVLFRKNRDFAPVVDSMARHDIPVEVANLGGLLSVPEIGDLRAWLTILDRPEDSAALIQILLGSRYRLGLADLAPLTRWLASAAGDDIGIDVENVPSLSLLEALEDLGSIPGLRPGAKAALEHFLGLYRDLLTRSQGMSLVETARLTLDRTRAWQDAESLPHNQRMTTRLNLYRLLDLTEDWSPLKGRPSLEAFLDYLDAMEDEPAEELDSAHLSGEDAVTLVTVHRAKGLEWDVVAIPVVTKGNFPSSARQFPDPIKFAEYLPPDLRIDHVLDDMPDELKEREDYFRVRNDLQEWRVAYVATTRARSTLMVSGSYWQGMLETAKTPREPSPLFTLVEEEPGTVIDGHEAEPPPRPSSLRIDPVGPDPDPLFADGWDGALRRSVDEADFVRSIAVEHGLGEEWEAAAATMRETLFDLDSMPAIVGQKSELKTVSVTGLVTYARCPKRFFWTEIDPLPRRRNRAAAAGTELHRRIELHQLGQVPFEEMSEELYDAVDDDAMAGSRAGGFKTFLDSKYGKSSAALVEAPFTIELGDDYRLRGRIDAIYINAGKWEIVDFKSGRPTADGSKIVQLEAYALAASEVDFGHQKPEELDVSFVYLSGGLTVETEHADRLWLERAQTHLVEMTGSIGDEQFDATPGQWCNHCDFLRFCPSGREYLDRSD